VLGRCAENGVARNDRQTSPLDLTQSERYLSSSRNDIYPHEELVLKEEHNLEDAPTSGARTGRVYIIVLNWNGWRDTVECLESVLRLDYPDYKVVVCDNGSTDGSLDHIRRWANGCEAVESRNAALAALTSPPVPKPIPFAELDPALDSKASGDSAVPLLLIQTGANLGFGGGNNVGLRYVLNCDHFDFIWLLNNDTVVRPDALSHLVLRMKERPDAGICGSTLLYYDDPSMVQAWGGSVFNKWVSRGGHIGAQAHASQPPAVEEVERKMAYVVGASMLVRRSFLERVGLIDEQYFFGFDEIDWATSAKGQFRLAYSPRSVVYHKEGSAMGSHRTSSRRSATSEFYTIRSRVLFTKKHYPFALPTVLCAIALSALHRVLNRRWKNLGALARGTLQGLSMTKNPRSL
jgi:GT2 family glycosyltransferase